MGQKLPTEAALSKRFGVNRHTVRRAIAAMGEQDLVHSRRGAGVFVTQIPTEYPIGQRVRFHKNLQAAGRIPAKEILAMETRCADTFEADALGLCVGDMVHAYKGLSRADGQPIAMFRSVFPAHCFPGLPAELERHLSVTKALRVFGINDYTRSSTRLNATSANATQALHLQVREGAPLLRTIAVNIDPDGKPIEYGTSWFVGDRVTLTIADT